MFWVAPILGGDLIIPAYRWLSDEPSGLVEGKVTA
jgi:aquaporin Z